MPMKRGISIIATILIGTIFLQCNGRQVNFEQEAEASKSIVADEFAVYNVEFVVGKLSDQMVYLAEFMKSSNAIIDSTMSANGSFYFSFPAEQHPGTYRVYFGRPEFNNRNAPERMFIEFIWSMENFSIYADLQDIKGSVQFENSLENDVLGEFREFETKYEEKMSAMYPLIDRYPHDDEFFTNASDHFLALQKERAEFITTLSGKHPELYVAGLIKAYLSLILSPEMEGPERMEYLRLHFFDMAPIDQPMLLFSPVYNYKIIEYLSLYRDQNNSYSQQEDAFIEASDIIMANVSADADLRSFIVEYLLEGFNSFQMERVQTYIAENYVDETCTTDAVELAIQRVEGYKKMELGAEATDFKVRSIDNEAVVLSKIQSDYTIVVFWASNCDHCVRMMPKLKEWYQKDRPENVELVAISIDTVKTNWTSYVQDLKLPWINVHEPLGWEGKSASDYNVYATPTIFVLDKKRVIRAKPLTYRELKMDIKRLVKLD
jgi:thiol-disulfide isomerase/thioredoxin